MDKEPKTFYTSRLRHEHSIQPDEVQFNTPLSPAELECIREHFKGFMVSSVYEEMKPEVKVIDKKEVIRGRGVGE